MILVEVSGSLFLRVPFPKEPGTRLKNRFSIFLDMKMSGCNLSSILEQITTGSRVLRTGTRPGSWEWNPKLTPLDSRIFLVLLQKKFF